MCIIVVFVGLIGINFNGVIDSIIEIVDSIFIIVIFFIFIFFIDVFVFIIKNIFLF